jgi:hypothetical protein
MNNCTSKAMKTTQSELASVSAHYFAIRTRRVGYHPKRLYRRRSREQQIKCGEGEVLSLKPRGGNSAQPYVTLGFPHDL